MLSPSAMARPDSAGSHGRSPRAAAGEGRWRVAPDVRATGGDAAELSPTAARARHGAGRPARIGAGDGVLCGTIVAASGRLPPCPCSVKVSFVEPGPGLEVMFRSKEAVFDTGPCAADKVDAPRWDAAFEYNIFQPVESDWAGIDGDLLFTVYEERRNKVFVGQVLVPLYALVDGPPIHGGTQATQSAHHLLTARDGSPIDGQPRLHLNLRLELPAEEVVSPRSHSGSQFDNDEDEEQIWPEQRRKSNLTENRADKSSRLSSATSHSSIKGKRRQGRRESNIAALQTQRRARLRLNRLRDIERENNALQKRLELTKTTVSRSQGGRRLASARLHSAQRQSSRSEPAADSAAEGPAPPRNPLEAQGYSETNELAALSEESQALRERRAELASAIAKLKVGLARDQVVVKKLRAEALRASQRAEQEQAEEKSSTCGAQDTFGPRRGRRRPKITYADDHVDSHQLMRLRADAVREFKKVQAANSTVKDLVEQAQQALVADSRDRDRLAAVNRECQELADDLEQANSARLSAAKFQDSEAAATQEQELRVEIAVTKSMQELAKRTNAFDFGELHALVEQLQGKLARKLGRLQNETGQCDELKAKHAKLLAVTQTRSRELRSRIEALEAGIRVLEADENRQVGDEQRRQELLLRSSSSSQGGPRRSHHK